MLTMQEKQEIAERYLNAYTAAQQADMSFNQSIWIQFGGNKSRWDVKGSDFNAATNRAFLDKVNADHDLSFMVAIMRENGASLEDLGGFECE